VTSRSKAAECSARLCGVSAQTVDARFSALARTYRYRIADGPEAVDPLRRHDVLAWPRPLDLAALQTAGAGLLGEHDFAAYCKRRDGATTIRRLLELDWARGQDGLLVMTIRADAFCHSMVRSIVGAMLAVGEGRREASWPARLLSSAVRVSEVAVAPPHALVLEHVAYPPDEELLARQAVTRNLRASPPTFTQRCPIRPLQYGALDADRSFPVAIGTAAATQVALTPSELTMSEHPTPRPGLTRRRLLIGGAVGAAGTVAASSLGGAWAWAAPPPQAQAIREPFTLGIASGDPQPGSVVLWTRLAPEPSAPDGRGGMPDRTVPVHWEIADDEGFRRVVARGTERARPELGHSVHAEVDGLRPGAQYFYRFKTGPELSPVGRTRTAPAAGARLDRLAFAFTSCQKYSHGLYTAHARMAEEDLDLVVQLGDYIYEGARNENDFRPHEGTGEPVTLGGYRNRYAQYKGDPDLQASHAAAPWILVLDDHEVDNDWADEVPQDPEVQSREAFLARRAAAFQAYYEHQPLRRSSLPRGIDIQLYRRLTFGDLLDVHVLDTRQYRSDQNQAARLDPTRTILGDEQEQWLRSALAGPTARWNALAQQVIFSQLDLTGIASFNAAKPFSDDLWDNYVADRDGLVDHLAAVGTANPVILTGDVHANYVFDVKADFDDPASRTVATELVGTSISTKGNGRDQNPSDAIQLANNPHIHFLNRNRGYVRNVVTPREWTVDFRVVDDILTPGAPVRTKATYVIEDGRPGAQPA